MSEATDAGAWSKSSTGQERPTDLTDGELIGVSVLLTQYCNSEPAFARHSGVYWDARQKIQPQVEKAMES